MAERRIPGAQVAANILDFFKLASDRHEIYVRRVLRKEPPPWTENPIFRDNRFCNLYRELDKTTVWFRENMRNDPEFCRNAASAVATCVAFRWFNKIEIGEVLKDRAIGLRDGRFDVSEARRRILHTYPNGPFVTGAYIVKTPDGMTKLEGVLACIDRVVRDAATLGSVIHNSDSLEKSWEALRQYPYLGDFMAYEVVSDMRWTPLLGGNPSASIAPASDINSWANAGPGCARGISRLFYGYPEALSRNSKADQPVLLQHMRELLHRSRTAWVPSEEHHAPAWEMREVEHWLCEYDKYLRVQEGGRMKQKFDWRTRK